MVDELTGDGFVEPSSALIQRLSALSYIPR